MTTNPTPDNDFTGDDAYTADTALDATAAFTTLRASALADRETAGRYHDPLTEVRGHVERKRQRLADLRRARSLTQQQLATQLDMTQSELSRLERRDNLMISTLAKFIAATGGQLRFVAVYDDIEVDIDLNDASAPESSPNP